MSERVATGIRVLDEMLGGGLHRGSIGVVKGPPGSGKTTLGLTFLAHGATKEEKGLLITFEHFPKDLYRDGLSIGIDLKELEKKKAVKIIFTSPEAFQSLLFEADGEFDRLVTENGFQRIFLDSINHFERFFRDPGEMRENIYALFNAFRRHNLTALVAQEDDVLTGCLSVTPYGLSFMIDTLIQLRLVEVDSHLEKAILIIKHRASSHDTRIRRLVISGKGPEVKEEFKGLEGLLSGVSSHYPLSTSLKLAKKLFETD